MRIALVAEWLDAWRGGAETSTLQFVRHLIDAGVHVSVFTRSRPSPAPGLDVHTIHAAAMSRTRQSAAFARRTAQMLRRDRFDVVHAISPFLPADIYQPRGGTMAETIERNLALRSSRASRSLKRSANALNLKQRYLLRTERRIMAAADRPIVVAISDYVVRQLRAHYELPEARIRKIYNGVDADAAAPAQRAADRAAVRREFGIGDRDLLVLVVAHNFRLKGVHRWMEAQARLVCGGGPAVRSLVVGRGASAAWRRLAERLGVAGHLTFVGPSERVAALRHASDVLAHPTYYDPCSRVVLEGMAGGLPCVTTRWDGAAEMIDDGVNGFVLDDPADVAGLVERIERMRDDDLRRRMGEAARAVVNRVSMARHAAEMMALYRELAAAPGGL